MLTNYSQLLCNCRREGSIVDAKTQLAVQTNYVSNYDVNCWMCALMSSRYQI